jgi:pyruvate kinase
MDSGFEEEAMSYRDHKTKIVCTIGPATDTVEMMQNLITAGMDIARLNYSHGDFEYHAGVIRKLRQAAEKVGRSIVIMADLPGPKIRLGDLLADSYVLEAGESLILSSLDFVGDQSRMSVTLPTLPMAVKPGDVIFLNDGIIQVQVQSTTETEINCKIMVGGEIRAHKGLNIPEVNLGVHAFTPWDHECLKSALENGVDAVSQSFVDDAQDIVEVRHAVRELGHKTFIIAKIERAAAVSRLEEILAEADGIMIARGDLGVEIPIDRLALVQKQIISLANLHGKPVITATQMLESMVNNPRPTRAEATDVANAVLDGTDCIMLSEESAIGKYPIEAVKMLSKISATTEPSINVINQQTRISDFYRLDAAHITDIVSHNVFQTTQYLHPALLVAHTVTGHIARMISRFKLPIWIIAACSDPAVCQSLQFSWGLRPVCIAGLPEDWENFMQQYLDRSATDARFAILVDVPSADQKQKNHRLEIIDISGW